MKSDPARAALIRYLGECMRAELRAQDLLTARQARTRAAKQQIVDWDRQRAESDADETQQRARSILRRREADIQYRGRKKAA